MEGATTSCGATAITSVPAGRESGANFLYSRCMTENDNFQCRYAGHETGFDGLTMTGASTSELATPPPLLSSTRTERARSGRHSLLALYTEPAVNLSRWGPREDF